MARENVCNGRRCPAIFLSARTCLRLSYRAFVEFGVLAEQRAAQGEGLYISDEDEAIRKGFDEQFGTT